MIRPANEGIEVWLCVEPVDFRKQITGLATLVQDTLAMDPFSTQLFVFTNRRRTQCRILYWEKCGFVLWQKRLERARFAWPRRTDAMVNLSGSQLNFLVDGYDIWRMRAHRTPALELRPGVKLKTKVVRSHRLRYNTACRSPFRRPGGAT